VRKAMAILQNSPLDSYDEGRYHGSDRSSAVNEALSGTCGMGLAVEDGLVVVKALLPSGSAMRSGQVPLYRLAWDLIIHNLESHGRESKKLLSANQ
jgi:hypothetical protein